MAQVRVRPFSKAGRGPVSRRVPAHVGTLHAGQSWRQTLHRSATRMAPSPHDRDTKSARTGCVCDSRQGKVLSRKVPTQVKTHHSGRFWRHNGGIYGPRTLRSSAAIKAPSPHAQDTASARTGCACGSKRVKVRSRKVFTHAEIHYAVRFCVDLAP